MDIFKKVLDVFKEDTPPPKSKEAENQEIISIYHQIKEVAPDYDEPNYTLAEKVFREYNDFNLKNIIEIHHMYLDFIPQSLLPYPKNYIKCAYYLFRENAEKQKDLKMFNLIQEVGSSLFFSYPNWEKYQEKLKHKAMYDDVIFKDGNPFNGRIPREEFKKLYGAYQISKEEYDNSPNSTSATNEKLIHDFGVLREIEEDVDWGKILKDDTKNN